MKWRPTDNAPFMLAGAGLFCVGWALCWLGFVLTGIAFIAIGLFLFGAL